MMCTNMTTILSHQEDFGPNMLDVKYEGLGGTGLVTTPLNMAPNLSECNVSHGGIAPDTLRVRLSVTDRVMQQTLPITFERVTSNLALLSRLNCKFR